MSNNTYLTEAREAYLKVNKLAKKETGTLPVLDEILKEKNIIAPREIPLGLVQIPLELIVGTKTVGRGAAFSKGFYPLLRENTEFFSKWTALYSAHMEEGIHDPIKAYEFMNKFYVEEGNKRVSVLKYFDAVSIPANVIRIVPPRTGEKDNIIYYEFMEFYNLSQINYIWFSQIGSFARLQRLVGKRPDEKWSEDDKLTFSSVFSRFTAEYRAHGGDKLPILVGDAFLSFIKVYDYHTLDDMTSSELKEKLEKSWEEFKLLLTDTSVELQMDPENPEKKKPLLERLKPSSTAQQHVAFIHEKAARTSAWTYTHELGRMHLDEAFPEQIVTTAYDNATADNIDALLEKAIADGNNVIFTTSPPLLKASLKAAIEHPEVKILNCSLNTSHHYIRTYYARMYEAKFLMGAIAGAMSENDKIGYIADYPIYGMTANINAFALGAKMVNPRAKIYLEWSTLKDHDPAKTFAENEISYISGQDSSVPNDPTRHFGLYRSSDYAPINLAMPIWHWGVFYEKMIQNILNGSFKYDDTTSDTKGLNYWWGMSTGIIDVICSKHLPIGTARLIDLLKTTICQGHFNPFTGILYSQNGVVQWEADKVLSPEEIITMDWLAENVIGFIPRMEDLREQAIPVVKIQGIEDAEK